MNESPTHPLVSLARRYFITYYALADEKEAVLMDSLIMARAALIQSVEYPRDLLPIKSQNGFERTSDSLERFFTELRELVRQSDAFTGLPPHHRERIERDAFDIRHARFG